MHCDAEIPPLRHTHAVLCRCVHGVSSDISLILYFRGSLSARYPVQGPLVELRATPLHQNSTDMPFITWPTDGELLLPFSNLSCAHGQQLQRRNVSGFARTNHKSSFAGRKRFQVLAIACAPESHAPARVHVSAPKRANRYARRDVCADATRLLHIYSRYPVCVETLKFFHSSPCNMRVLSQSNYPSMLPKS